MDLNVTKRNIFGKKAKTLKSEGLIPAELYGRGIENIHLSVPVKEFSKLYKEAGESTIINLVLDNKKIPSLIYSVSSNSLTDAFSNIDFYAVKMDEKIKTAVPLSFIGEAPAVKGGGILVKSMQEIEVEALPGDLLSHIDVDLSSLLEINSSIRVKDLNIAGNNKVKIFVDLETVVATVIEAAKEEVEVKPVSVEDVKVEGEEKKKEAAAKEEAKK